LAVVVVETINLGQEFQADLVVVACIVTPM
jgi:hypothetical protein